MDRGGGMGNGGGGGDGEGSRAGGESVYELRRRVYKAAEKGKLEEVKQGLEKYCQRPGHEEALDFPFELNPLQGVVEGSGRSKIVEMIIVRWPKLFQTFRSPQGDNFLHMAAAAKQETLAINVVKFLSGKEKREQAYVSTTNFISWKRERRREEAARFQLTLGLLDDVNVDGDTVLHIATNNLLKDLVAEIVMQPRLKVNAKNKDNQTPLDIVLKKCASCTIKKDWKTPWKVSILLRGVGAKKSRMLVEYEDDDYTIKRLSPIELIVANDKSWDLTVNTNLLVATLALTLVFAALFTVPQTLSSGGSNIQDNLSHNKPFIVFLSALSVGCLMMVLEMDVLLFLISTQRESRALILAFSWESIIIMGLSISVACLAVVYIYMGSFFTYVMFACCLVITIVHLVLAFILELLQSISRSVLTLIRMSLLEGLIISLLLTFLPQNHVLSFLDSCNCI